jgi:hypothetical protein
MNPIRPSLSRTARPQSARLAGALAVLVLAVGAASALDLPSEPKAPLAPSGGCEQDCFDNYADNMGRCNSIFCTHVLFITLYCDDVGLSECGQKAGDVFDACMAHCNQTTA